MNISHEWLARFVPHGRSPEAIRDLLTAHVATVEGLERLRADLVPFVVGRVVASERIPETKLSFNQVDDGSGTLLDVVCGAPNVTVGASYPFARTGTTMPGGLVIEKRKIRGFTSNGMLCSARELGLGEDHDGILTLTTAAAPGTPLLDVLPLGDVRLLVDVLPNRPDLLSHLGVALEVAALTGTPLQRPPEIAALPPVAVPVVRADREARAGGVTVRIEERAECSQYGAAVLSGLTVAPSPAWLRAAVEAVGGRSINNLVDATNYLLHGFGQPMHAFDATALQGDTLIVRRARAGEQLVTLDGATRTLDPTMLVIADAAAPTALAGVMGGRGSEVTEATTRVVLEVACFAPALVRATRRKAGLSTDASYRFERGIDGGAVGEMLAIGAALLAHLGGGQVDALLHLGAAPTPAPPLTVRPARVAAVLGDAVPAEEIGALLRGIGFGVREGAGGALLVTVPTWRHDVSREVDLVEEVARLRGFDRLPDTLHGARPGTAPDDPLFVVGRRLRDALVADGLHEVRPLPFTAGAPEGFVRVQNPLAEDEPYLRRRVLDTLARRAEYNLNRMQGDVRLFEVGAVFAPDGTALPVEEQRVAALLMGARRPVHFSEPQPPAFDAWDAKALGERTAAVAFPSAHIALEPGEGEVLWRVLVDGEAAGTVERVALDAPVWAQPAFGVELTLGRVANAPVAAPGTHVHGMIGTAAAGRAPIRYRPLPTTPAALFDLALIVPDAVPAAAVEAVVREVSGTQLEAVVLFDEFRGTGVADGARSLAWRLTFRHPERTLRDKEIEGRRAQLLKALEERLGVRPRSV
ncbi:MAG: phenylalanine--tRNA ligase subunit beta [Gemmatimonadota bacterium]|nr:phenylalanine--tRNA ligase subunit beta [Gemmatimonadota bacterium]MDQ8147057.1 phenylalanine--tRNA ligase subunit beta [Gemmatimonadota bacterium]MDQ8148635.1 phenylalanine--tRNA ligase subunit beta [Gemmatimonadota bacterium]MDQ8176327.1 phenylalanine--tRNA ligase subunit beta [Gemmatimonadota bacterium]